MSDYIKREDAIYYAQWEGAYKVVMHLEEMPAADVKIITYGHWIDDHEWMICSHCGKSVLDEYREKRDSSSEEFYTSCPYCGSDMSEEA